MKGSQGIYLVLALGLLFLLGSQLGLFSIFSQGGIEDVEGMNCNFDTSVCIGSKVVGKSEVNIDENWKMDGEYQDWNGYELRNGIIREFFYHDWDLYELKRKEVWDNDGPDEYRNVYPEKCTSPELLKQESPFLRGEQSKYVGYGSDAISTIRNLQFNGESGTSEGCPIYTYSYEKVRGLEDEHSYWDDRLYFKADFQRQGSYPICPYRESTCWVGTKYNFNSLWGPNSEAGRDYGVTYRAKDFLIWESKSVDLSQESKDFSMSELKQKEKSQELILKYGEWQLWTPVFRESEGLYAWRSKLPQVGELSPWLDDKFNNKVCKVIVNYGDVLEIYGKTKRDGNDLICELKDYSAINGLSVDSSLVESITDGGDKLFSTSDVEVQWFFDEVAFPELLNCIEGSTQCLGFEQFKCINDKLVNQGLSEECGALLSCTTGNYEIENENYRICEDSIWGEWKPLTNALLEINRLIKLVENKAQLIMDLTDNLEEQGILINELEVNINVKVGIINSLTSEINNQIVLISQLETNLEEKIQIVNQLTSNLNEQAQFIEALTETSEEQAEIIFSLELSIQEQAEIIVRMQLTVDEQAALINQLGLNLDEQAEIIENLDLEISQQAALINQLQINLNQKSYLISQLQATNEDQASLISEMELSLSEQAEIIDAFNNLLGDDLEIINNLQLTVEEQRSLIADLERTNDEKQQLISQLELTISQQAENIISLNLNIQEQAALINSLELTNEEKADLINQLHLSLLEQAELINAFNLEIEDDAEIIFNLQLSLEEQGELISSMQLTLEEDAVIIAELNLELSEERALIESLTTIIAEQEALLEILESGVSGFDFGDFFEKYKIIIIIAGGLFLLLLVGGRKK